MLSLVALLAIAHPPKFGAWVLLDDDGTSFSAFQAHVSSFDSVTGQFYTCTKDGGIQHEQEIKGETLKSFVDFSHAHHVAVFGLVGDGGLGTAGVEYFLSTPELMAHQADALCDACVTDNLEGIDLDYESMKATDKDAYSQFVEVVAQKLHRKHKKLAMAICAKDQEPGNWSGSQSEDYARIGKAVDRARIMTYDEHEDGGAAGPIADIAWVRSVMTYAATQIPKQKLEVGIPAYGYNWSKPKATGVTWTQFSALPGADKAGRDPISNELLLTTDSGAAWFCDSVSEKPKLDLVNELGLRGAYMWVMGSEDPKWWDLFKK